MVSHGDAAGNSFAGLGIQLNSKGQFAFDADAFNAAYTADPASAQKTVTGLATSLSTLASNTSISTRSAR